MVSRRAVEAMLRRVQEIGKRRRFPRIRLHLYGLQCCMRRPTYPAGFGAHGAKLLACTHFCCLRGLVG